MEDRTYVTSADFDLLFTWFSRCACAGSAPTYSRPCAHDDSRSRPLPTDGPQSIHRGRLTTPQRSSRSSVGQDCKGSPV